MAGPTKAVHRGGIPIDAAITDTISKLVADVETLRAAHGTLAAKLDADAGVTDTNYNALTTPAASALTGYKLADA